MTDDPFSPEADPYRVSQKVTRREVARLVAAVATASSVALGGCATTRRLACPTQSDKERCQAPFCRYFGKR